MIELPRPPAASRKPLASPNCPEMVVLSGKFPRASDLSKFPVVPNKIFDRKERAAMFHRESKRASMPFWSLELRVIAVEGGLEQCLRTAGIRYADFDEAIIGEVRPCVGLVPIGRWIKIVSYLHEMGERGRRKNVDATSSI